MLWIAMEVLEDVEKYDVMWKSDKSLKRIKLAVLKSNDGKDLIVTCECGCDEGLHIRI